MILDWIVGHPGLAALAIGDLVLFVALAVWDARNIERLQRSTDGASTGS